MLQTTLSDTAKHWDSFLTHCSPPIDKDNLTKEEVEAIEKWEYEDSVASYLLSQCLPDTTIMHLSTCSTTKEHWDMVTLEYQAKSAYAQANLH